jgi:hypothetical protein
MSNMPPEQHNRKTDNMSFPHDRISDPVLIDLLASVKINNNKLDSVIEDVSDIKKRISTVENGQVVTQTAVANVSNKVDATTNILTSHAREEEKILKDHAEAIVNLNNATSELKRGFPKNEDGERDPRSHADDHEEEAIRKKDFSELYLEIRKWAVISLLAALGTGIGYLIASGTKVELTRAVVEENDVRTPIHKEAVKGLVKEQK